MFLPFPGSKGDFHRERARLDSIKTNNPPILLKGAAR